VAVGLWIAIALFTAAEFLARFDTLVGFNELSDINAWASLGDIFNRGRYLEYVPGMPFTPSIASLMYPPGTFALQALLFRCFEDSLRALTVFYTLANVLKLGLILWVARAFLSRRMALLCVLFCVPFVFRHLSYGPDVLAVMFYLAALGVLLRAADADAVSPRRAAAVGVLLGLMFSFKQNLAVGSCVVVSVVLMGLPFLKKQAVHRTALVETLVLLAAAAYCVVVLGPYPWDMRVLYGLPPLAALAWIRFQISRAPRQESWFSSRPFWALVAGATLVAVSGFLFWSRPVGPKVYFYGQFLMGSENLFDMWALDFMRFGEPGLTLLGLLVLYGVWAWTVAREGTPTPAVRALRWGAVLAFAAVCVVQRRLLFSGGSLGMYGDLLLVWPFALSLGFMLIGPWRDRLRTDMRSFTLFVATAFLYIQLYPGFDETHMRFMLFPMVFLTFWLCDVGVGERRAARLLTLLPLVAYMTAFHAWELRKIGPMLSKGTDAWAYLDSARAKVWLPRPLADSVRDVLATVREKSGPEDPFFETGLFLRYMVDRPYATGYRLDDNNTLIPPHVQAYMVRQFEAAPPPLILTNARDYGPGGNRLSSADMATLKGYLDGNYEAVLERPPFILLSRKAGAKD
jgi:hypothetical protein